MLSIVWLEYTQCKHIKFWLRDEQQQFLQHLFEPYLKGHIKTIRRLIFTDYTTVYCTSNPCNGTHEVNHKLISSTKPWRNLSCLILSTLRFVLNRGVVILAEQCLCSILSKVSFGSTGEFLH